MCCLQGLELASCLSTMRTPEHLAGDQKGSVSPRSLTDMEGTCPESVSSTACRHLCVTSLSLVRARSPHLCHQSQKQRPLSHLPPYSAEVGTKSLCKDRGPCSPSAWRVIGYLRTTRLSEKAISAALSRDENGGAFLFFFFGS